jgi:NitT/TauT family transport system substrate-binding protein
MVEKGIFRQGLQTIALILALISVLLITSVTAEPKPIRVSAGPNIWFAQPSVIIGEELDKQVGLSFEQIRYPGPANMLQAFAAGEIDCMNNNVAAAFLAAGRGIDIRFVAQTFRGDIFLLGEGELLELSRKSGPAAALREFTKLKGRKLKLVTNPRGSLSDLNARFWLRNTFGDYESLVEVTHAADQAQLQQLYLSGSADLLAAFSPLLEILGRRRPAVGYFAKPADLMTSQPGGALVVRAKFAADHPDIITKLRELYRRATLFMIEHPDRAAMHVEKYLMEGLLSRELIASALRANQAYLVSDAADMRQPAQLLHDFMIAERYLKHPIDLNLLFAAAVTE